MARGFLSEGKGSYDRQERGEYAEVDVTVRRTTEKAIGVADPNKAGNILWLPRSLCHLTSRG